MELQTNVKTGDLKISEGSAPVVTQPVVTKEPDLVTKVSQVKIEKPEPTGDIKEPEFDFKDIESITDPVAKEQALKAYKSFQKGFNQKFQEIAEIRKSLEKQKPAEDWTPERVQHLINDPNFVKAAQSVVGSKEVTETDDFSSLTDREKQKLQQLEAEVSNMRQASFMAVKAQQDTELKNRYANYDPQAVDTITADLLAGKVQATREHLWKVQDYDDAVRRAYELGKKDSHGIQQEKLQSTSVEGLTAVKSNAELQPAKGESNLDYFRRLVNENMKKQKTEQIRK